MALTPPRASCFVGRRRLADDGAHFFAGKDIFMDAVLRHIADALAELSNRELHALIVAAKGLPRPGQRFPGWFELVADRE
jgi:hypothetical protein